MNHPTLIKILEQLVAFRTIKGSYEEFDKALNYVANFLSERSMYVEQFTINHVQSLVASTHRTNHKKPMVMLAAHIDVVPGSDDTFTLKKKSGRLYGRGALDMKFAIAAFMKLADDLGDQLSEYDFGIMITSDEESGGQNGVEALLKQGFKPQVVILPDAGDAPTSWKFELSAKGAETLQIITHGTSTHGSRPWNGDNAIYKMTDLLQEVRELFKDQHVGSNSLTVAMLQAGQATNQVPHEATAILDIRCLTDNDQKHLRKAIQAICQKYKADFSELYPYSVAVQADLHNPFTKTFLNCLEQITSTGVAHSHSTGTSDARYFSKAAIPCIIASPPGNGYHDPVEWVSEQGINELLASLSYT